ncbi:hypothetical protein BN59_03303 [Legionella massiliensis]|uniref:Uncharacterized protein n=1 Tax=Legionella massiliensis TaxID=1034943 RepID=A0A078L504_9GAMM|nr:hypothetical protein [Legionella massiliensis]CDZ78988.1 hypothetical protein BN59_03303 [Legionella massiliensis]CEE14726.1 hypothetical protein BN1094_03303 [Legionella massiliensis]
MSRQRRELNTRSMIIDLIAKASEVAFDDGHDSKRSGYKDWKTAAFQMGQKDFNAGIQVVANILINDRKMDAHVERLRSQLAVVCNVAHYLKDLKDEPTNDQVKLLEKKYLDCVDKAQEMLDEIARKKAKGKTPKVREGDNNFLENIVAGAIPVLALLKATKETSKKPDVGSYGQMQVLAQEPKQSLIDKLANQASQAKELAQAMNKGNAPAQQPISTELNNAALESLKSNPKIKALRSEIDDKILELAEARTSDPLAQAKYDILNEMLERIDNAKTPSEYLEAVHDYAKKDSDNLITLNTGRGFWVQLFSCFVNADTGNLVRDLDKAVEESMPSICPK